MAKIPGKPKQKTKVQTLEEFKKECKDFARGEHKVQPIYGQALVIKSRPIKPRASKSDDPDYIKSNILKGFRAGAK